VNVDTDTRGTEMTRNTTWYTVTNVDGLALGRSSLASSLGWVDPQYASCFENYTEARDLALRLFGTDVGHLHSHVDVTAVR
jgi:hypothetical protein